MKKTLKLTVHGKAFEVMVTGEKTDEYRNRSKWMDSRLWKKTKDISGVGPVFEPREYDFIEIRNGYGKNRPVFTAKFIDFATNLDSRKMCFSNGLIVEVKEWDYIIRLGKIINIQNYKI